MWGFVREIYFLFRNRDLFLEENDLNLDTNHSRQRRIVLTRLILDTGHDQIKITPALIIPATHDTAINN